MSGRRVLLVNNYPPPLGGAEQHVATVQALLREHGDSADLLSPEPSAGLRALTDRVANRRFAATLRERIERTRPDVVHVHNFMKRLGAAPLSACRRARVPTVLTVHDYQLVCPRTWAVRGDGRPCPAPELARCLFGDCMGSLRGASGRVTYALNALRRPALATRVARDVTVVTAPARALCERLERVLGRTVRHLPYPFEPVGDFVAPASRRLLFVGRVAVEKGLAPLLDAMRDVPAAELTIAGDGPALPALRAQVERDGLGARVRFVGAVGHERVRELMLQHGAVVVPSLWMDNSPLVVHEAFAAGRPVLGARRGGIPELIDEGGSGALFEPTDRRQVAAALRWFGERTNGEHEQLARAAHARAAAGAPATFVEALRGVYDEAAAGVEVAL